MRINIPVILTDQKHETKRNAVPVTLIFERGQIWIEIKDDIQVGVELYGGEVRAIIGSKGKENDPDVVKICDRKDIKR